MAKLREYKLEHREDVWKIPENTRILYVNCGLSQHSASRLVENCRLLEKVVFSGDAYALTGESTREQLGDNVFLEIRGSVKHHGLVPSLVKNIKQKYSSGTWTIDRLAEHFRLPSSTIWHALHDKHPVYVRKKAKRGGMKK